MYFSKHIARQGNNFAEITFITEKYFDIPSVALTNLKPRIRCVFISLTARLFSLLLGLEKFRRFASSAIRRRCRGARILGYEKVTYSTNLIDMKQ